MLQQHAEQFLSNYLATQQAALVQEIQNEPHNQLLNVNEITYIAYLVQKYSPEPLILHWEQQTIDDYDKSVSASELPLDIRFANGISSADSRQFKRSILVYHVPFSGNSALLKYRPMTCNLSLPKFTSHNNELTFEVPYSLHNQTEAKTAIERNREYFREHISRLNTEITTFNANLKNSAQAAFKSRKDELLRRSQLLSSIGIPIKRIEDTQQGLIIPIKKKFITLKKPQSTNEPFVPEPTIDEADYQEILRICHSYGVQMERLPSLYKETNGKIKCEEDLRDGFLSTLAVQYDYTTGETFNKSGKTDILIQHEGKTAFVAECKFWHGAKAHFDTIDQLLGYLTWRDSKSSILYFVDNTKNKNLDHVLGQIQDQTVLHPCFVKYNGNKEESWFKYHFHLLEDESRSVQLTILVFYLT